MTDTSITRIPPPPGKGAVLIPDRPIIVDETGATRVGQPNAPIVPPPQPGRLVDISFNFSLPQQGSAGSATPPGEIVAPIPGAPQPNFQNRILGSGAFGEVWTNGPNGVIKRFFGQESGEIPGEVPIAQRLFGRDLFNMPGVEGIYQTPEGNYEIAYTRARGVPLNNILIRNGGTLPPRTALQITRGVVQALERLANLPSVDNPNDVISLVHRDIKPDNIIVDLAPDQSVRSVSVVDVGLVIDSGTQSENVMGTPRYMSPEQFTGEPITPQSDIYSVGRVLYRMLTGQHFGPRRLRIRFNDLVEFTTSTDVTPAHPLLEEVPEGLRPLVARTMSLDPVTRPNPTELLVELNNRLTLSNPAEINQQLIDFNASVSETPVVTLRVSDQGTWIMPEVVAEDGTVIIRDNSLTAEPPTVRVEAPIEEATVPLSSPEPPSRLGALGRGVGAIGLPVLASMGTVALLQTLGVDPAEHQGSLTLAGIGSGHAAYLAFERLVTGSLPSLATQARGLGIGLPAGFFGSTIYNSFLDNVVEAAPDSAARSTIPEVGVGIGSGLGFMQLAARVPGAMIAMPFMVAAAVNEAPSMIYSRHTFESRERAIDQAKREMARAWEEDDDYVALFFLGLAETPIFTHIADFAITGDDE